MPTIQAIQTRYAGCRFRSRLEARWAVFFDHYGIAWEYEPQGHVVTDRLYICDRDEWPYLPDFWLPGLQLWVEVKGTLDDAEFRELLSTAAHLSSNDGGGCHDNGGNDLVVLGPIPRPGQVTEIHLRLHMHKGDLQESRWLLNFTHDGECFARDSSEVYGSPSRLLRGLPTLSTPRLNAAYTAARSARFEHGENG